MNNHKRVTAKTQFARASNIDRRGPKLETAIGNQQSLKLVDDVFTSICLQVDSPLSLAAYLLWKHKEYAQLVNMEISPLHYSSGEKFANDYLVTKYLSKFKDFRHKDLDPKKKAWDTFYDGEETCRTTNRKFNDLDLDPSKWDPAMESTFRTARRKIRRVLGEPNFDRISRQFGWGPGSTTSVSGKDTSSYTKFKARLDVTGSSLVMGHCCINSTPSWVNCQLQTDEYPSVAVSLLRSEMNIVRGNEIVLVPKNAKTERTIAKEPHVNAYLQKGFGQEIRSLLRRFAGIDLLTGQEHNQRLARQGSADGSISTIDLKNASGTISQGIVKYLLPDRWYTLLDSLRSKQGFIKEKNEWIYFQQFSSMGNGFTFELETLIFWALAKAASEEVGCDLVSVYGDDVIVSTDAFCRVKEVFEFAGFTLNESKSFSSGPFRESCGKDYFKGQDVRPVFLKETPNETEKCFAMANALRRYAHRRNFGYGCDRRFEEAWTSIVQTVPENLRNLKIPEGFGDVGLISNFDEATPSLARAPKGQETWEGFHFRYIRQIANTRSMLDRGATYVAYLEAAGRAETPFLGKYALRKSTRPKLTRGFVQRWQDLGPWC